MYQIGEHQPRCWIVARTSLGNGRRIELAVAGPGNVEITRPSAATWDPRPPARFLKIMARMSILERLARQPSESNDLKPLQSKEYER
jgi:hypothetical protein